MLIKKITLENFRQFKDIQSVEFSEDNVKNITIILGENGAGKTTFAQAFRWCLYGKTTFIDSILLNKEISQNLGPNKESFVRVSLQLIHNNIEYEITREQKYTTNATGGLNTPNSSELKIKYRNPQGITKFVEQREVDLRIKEILPSELSNYFFFDGEKIQNMSKEINEGKSAEFKDAVERLLGLSAFMITLDHLNGRSSSSVIKSYNRDFDSKANSQIADLQDKIDSLNKELNRIDERNKEIDDDVSKLEKQQEALSKEMEANKDSENLIKEKKGYEVSSEKLLLEEKGAKTEQQSRTQSSLDEQALKSDSNKKIAVYKAYAIYMYQLLKDDYSKREKEVRERLQENINGIFKNIYNGKLSLQVDEKYNIKVELDEFASYSGMIETSTAQSMSVIFAFIAGVIKMARENAKNRNSDMSLQSEPYPLVMDAPLSNFDKKRVKNVCETLPKIAEQVIFFSYDKDAEVAEENMNVKIGKRYEFIKINELETRIEAR